MTVPTSPQGRWIKAVSDQLLCTGDGVVLAIRVANGASGAQFELNDSTDGTGADFLTMQGILNESQYEDYSGFGGIPFVTGCWIDWTAGTVYVLVDN